MGGVAGSGTSGNVKLIAPYGYGGSGYISFSTGPAFTGPDTERLRIKSTGDWSVGSTGSDVGTSGQVLTSQGSGTPPIWSNVTLSTAATNIVGGAAHEILVQSAASTTTFITAPSTANTYLEWTGSAFAWANPVTAPAGSNTQIQWNNSGAFGASANFYWTDSTSTLSIYNPNSPGFTGTLQMSNAGNFILQGSGGQGLEIADGGGTSIQMTASSGITVTTGGFERWVIDSSGTWLLSGGVDAGTSGYVLTSNGSGTAPTWQATSGVSSITAGTDISVSASTGAVTINDISTLSSVTGRGATTSTALTLNGGINVNAMYQNTTTTTFTSASVQTIDTFAVATYKTVKYLVQVTDSTNSKYHSVEVFLIAVGSTVYKTEYAEVYSSGSLGTFDASITSGNCNLTFTPVANSTYTVKVVGTYITA